MANSKQKAEQGLDLVEEAILGVLREEYPGSLQAREIRNRVAIRDPTTDYNNYLVDSLIKRLEDRGLVEQFRERGLWRLVVT